MPWMSNTTRRQTTQISCKMPCTRLSQQNDEMRMQLFLRCNKRASVSLFNMCCASATKQPRAWRPTDANTLKDRDDGGRRFLSRSLMHRATETPPTCTRSPIDWECTIPQIRSKSGDFLSDTQDADDRWHEHFSSVFERQVCDSMPSAPQSRKTLEQDEPTQTSLFRWHPA